MARYVALLRGVNVGGVKVAMADLRRVVEGLGYEDVRTYVNSGNVVLSAPGRASARRADEIAVEVERAIAAELEVAPRVIGRSGAALRKVVDATPYAAETDPKKVHVIFLAEEVDAAGREHAEHAQAIAAEKGSRDTLTIAGREVYLHTPDGFGRSVLATELNRRKASAAGAGTARNWSSVTRLLAMCEQTDGLT